MVYIVERKRKYMYGMGKCACIFECCVWAYMYMPVCFYMYVHYVCTHMYFYVYACGDVYIYICVSAYVGENVSMWYLVSMRISIIIGIFYSDSEKCCKTDKMITWYFLKENSVLCANSTYLKGTCMLAQP